MIRIDGKERNGFKNYIENDNIIEESNSNPTRSLKPIRMVFLIKDHDGLKTFTYLGKYKMDVDKSTVNKRVFIPLD